MTVSELLAPDVSWQVRERGREYFRQGRVRGLNVKDGVITATVQGSRDYQVELYLDNNMDMLCDCPYADEYLDVCKHIWAALLAAEAARLVDVEPVNGASHSPQGPSIPRWEAQIAQVEHRARILGPEHPWPVRRQLLYALDLRASFTTGSLVLYMTTRERKAHGEGWNASKELKLTRGEIASLPDEVDREILGYIGGAANYSWSYTDSAQITARQQIHWPLSARLLPLLCRTGRCYADLEHLKGPLAWDDSPWTFALKLDQHRQQTNLTGVFRRGDTEIDIQDPAFVMRGALIVGTTAAPLDDDAPMEWIYHLRLNGAIVARFEDADALLGRLLESPSAPRIQVPQSLRYEVISPEPKRILHVAKPRGATTGRVASQLQATLFFDYLGNRIPHDDERQSSFNPEQRVLFRRNTEAERTAKQDAIAAGVRELSGSPGVLKLAAKMLPAAVRELIGKGWSVEAEGRLFRTPGRASLSVTSGVDWFELHGSIQYEGTTASLPDILDAVRRGDTVVQLGDGSWGLLPEEWLNRLGAVTGFGEAEGDHLRFRKSQAALLDAMLAAQPDVQVDQTFATAREQLHAFTGIDAPEQPAAFRGVLRHYQLEGLGWMNFLRRFGFGGCLADDMGVGKTAQVLALLETRRGEGPSLIVVPRSLIFNWMQESAKFTPNLRILDHTGLDRTLESLGDYDVVLTTYGTMRRDIEELVKVEFDYLILDEAQSIRNPSTDSSKAARLLRGRHRLALTGTPVENRLGDLWSIFEFLNPGMLGSSRTFEAFSNASRGPGAEDRKVLARALRPLILRRTKEQVARELPEKTEQTIFCELEAPQRKLYNELRDYYRTNLLHQIGAKGLAKSKMQVLEALLRLRQAACHPGLIDTTKKNEASAKVDLLVDRLSEVAAEGHKALVFSQFTSLLAIVRKRLDEQRIVYEYLDGKTRDRQTPVERFQNDENCRLFLISLKAGGLGLNLTAAGYVFLLDPWWNPAVEAQAIDRAHRIGQTRQVFAYRLIAKDTVEEKVLELQSTKRELAAAIIGEENRILSDLRPEDLELLLS